MSFAKSDAIFPPADLDATLGQEYERQCRVLCYGTFPTWDEVKTVFQSLKSLL